MRRFSKLLCMTVTAAVVALPATTEVVDHHTFKILGAVVVWGADSDTAGANVPVVSDFVIDSGTGLRAVNSGDVDLISEDVHTVVTGSLDPVVGSIGTASSGSAMLLRRLRGQPNFSTDTSGDGLMDGSDGFGAFRLRNASDTGRMEVNTSFYVASNAPFNIDAQAVALGSTTATDLNNMRVRMRVDRTGNDGLAYGSRAQFPHSGGTAGGIFANNRRLSTLTTARRIFEGNQRTAATPGSIAQQSVRFDLRYIYRTRNYDLSYGALDAEAEVTYTVYLP